MKNNEALLWNLKLEFSRHDRSGIYGYTQRTLAYNSNRIEGSTLTETQTAALFEEGYLPSSEEIYKRKDIEEMNGHFLMFNKMLSTIDNTLSEDLIKAYHYELKAGVFEDRANGYAIGQYKKWRNTVGGKTLAEPGEVAEKMSELLLWYHEQTKITLETLAEFHTRYEMIHPFQDGNGRTGRMILYRECLMQGLTPFIIRNDNRESYIAALNKASSDDDYEELVSLFKLEQREYENACKYFDVEARYQGYLENCREEFIDEADMPTPKHK